MSKSQQPAPRRPVVVARLAAAIALLIGASLIGGVGWMVWYGNRQNMLFGYIFFGLLPFFLGVGLVLGGRKLWRGDPSGAAIARAALWLPLTLFVGGIASTPFAAKPHEKVPFLIFFGAVSVVLGSAAWLLTVAESRQALANRQLVGGTGNKPPL